MNKDKQHIILVTEIARTALQQLDNLPSYSKRTLFVIDEKNRLIGSLTDGDIRRGLLNGSEITNTVSQFINPNFKYLKQDENNLQKIKEFKNNDIFLIPIIDDENRLIEILDLKKNKTLLPITALILAGGKGERLKPLTDNTPKPMLLVGNKPILEYTIDRLISYGIKDIYISVKYLKEKIIDYFGDGSEKGIKIHYIIEDEPLGTLGSMSLIESPPHNDILVMNSDLLTNIDFEDFYAYYKEKNANMCVVSIPYHVNIPYAVIETKDFEITSFSEKPTYTYYSNGGIYMLNFSLQKYITKGSFFNATDLMGHIIEQSHLSLIHYPLLGYWLDIGKHQDFLKAQEDVKHINFS